MTDIVERLRDPDADFNAVPLLKEAADEIERLRVALHKSEAGLLLAQLELQALTGRDERLRAALQTIADKRPATCDLTLAHEMADDATQALTGREGGKP